MSEMSNIKAAQDVHHKLEFYLVAVAFTTAAFAIQTGRFSGFVIGDAAEALSWVLLVASGILGLLRLEYIPVAYRLHHYIQVQEQSLNQHEDNDEQHNAIAALKAQVAETEPKLKEIEGKNQARYAWQKRLLVIGFGLLLVARVVAQIIAHY
jgi:cell division protein FtsB